MAAPLQSSDGGASQGWATRLSLRGSGHTGTANGAQPEQEQAEQAQQARRLSSRELNSLLHSQQHDLQEPQQEGGLPWGRHLQQAANPAAPPPGPASAGGALAAGPPPPAQPILDARAADLSGSGASLYVVTTTGLEVNASDAGGCRVKAWGRPQGKAFGLLPLAGMAQAAVA